jgi:thiamine-phosphate diphosphorylase
MKHRPPPRFARLYPIVDVRDHRIDRARDLARVLLEAGAPWLQLRAKTLGDGAHLALARELVEVAAHTGAGIIVNDRCDIAAIASAAGVHLGQEDLAIAEARRILGPRAVIGVSTHDADEARAAEADGADYIGFGAIYATSSKSDARSPRGPEALATLRAAVRLPIVAIGGIDVPRADTVLAAGADAVAMIGALETAPDPASLVRRWRIP